MDRTHRAEQAIRKSRVVVGYTRYLELIKDLTRGKEIIASGMTQEAERCRQALYKAQEGKVVSLVSSGDAGVYGMAGLAFELSFSEGLQAPIEVVPGVTSAIASAARLGAPLMLDFACISLSDLLIPWDMILRRLEAVAAADLVVALYNPRSRKRVRQLDEASAIFRKYRPDSTPVGITTALGMDDERIVLSDLGHFLECQITMRSIVLIGNRSSKRLGQWLIPPRGYPL